LHQGLAGAHPRAAILEFEEHGWMQDRADPHARKRALTIARQDRRPAPLRTMRPQR
jgi:hypothetical protein